MKFELISDDTIEIAPFVDGDFLNDDFVSRIVKLNLDSVDDVTFVDKSMRISVARFHLVDYSLFPNDDDFQRFSFFKRMMNLIANKKKTSSPGTTMKLPSKISQCAYSFQLEGMRRGIFDFDGRFLLADEMGLGKTIQSLGVAHHYWSLGKKILVVCLSTLKENWRREIAHWIPEWRTKIVSSSNDVVGLSPDSFDVAIVSYELISNPKGLANTYLTKRRWCFVLVDESHRMQSKSSNISKCMVELLTKRCDDGFVLISGTPMPSRPAQLYMQMRALFRDDFAYVTWHKFTERWCDGRFNDRFQRWDVSGESNVFEFFSILRTRTIRRFVDDVLPTLPKKERRIVDLRIVPEDLKAYEDVRSEYAEFEKKMNSELGGAVGKKDAYLWGKRNEAWSMQLWRATSKAKTRTVVDFLRKYADDNRNVKFLVFAHNLAITDACYDVLVERLGSDKVVKINGSVDVEKRLPLVDSIVNGDVVAAVCGIKACGAGINFVPTVTKLIFAEYMFVPADHLQAEARIHRIKCVEPVECIYLHAKGTKDDSMLRILQSKYFVNDAVMDDGARSRDFSFDPSREKFAFEGHELYKYGIQKNARFVKKKPLKGESVENYVKRVGIVVNDFETHREFFESLETYENEANEFNASSASTLKNVLEWNVKNWTTKIDAKQSTYVIFDDSDDEKSFDVSTYEGKKVCAVFCRAEADDKKRKRDDEQ